MSKGTPQQRSTAVEMLAIAHSQTAGQHISGGNTLLCPSCSTGFLRFESEPLSGQTFETCGVCDYRSRFRSEAHQLRAQSIIKEMPGKYKHRRRRRAR